MSERFTCPKLIHPPRLYVDPEPGEWCAEEVENAGDYCPRHEPDDYDDPWAD